MKIFLGEKMSCALNYQDLLIYYELIRKYEITKDVKEADILVFPSSCSCTESKINDMIKYLLYHISQKKPGAKVYLTGCLTRPLKYPEQNAWLQSLFSKYIDFVIPQNEPHLLLRKISEDFNNLTEEFGCTFTSEKNKKTDIYISNGCRNNCHFCKVSYQDYPLKSAELSKIKEQIDMAAEHGSTIINLIGTNICEYGLDIYREPRLLEIIEYIEGKDKIEKVNLIGHAYKDAIRFGFATPFASYKKIDYISGSLETGSSRLLEMINKGYTPEEFIAYVKEIESKYKRRVDLNIISGLPTETKMDIEETLRVLRELNPYSVEISEYIDSSMLRLSRLPQLSDEEIRAHTTTYEEGLKRSRIKTSTLYKSSK